MAWVKLTDDFGEHPKVLRAGPLAGWWWVHALAYSNRHHTDGFIDRVKVPTIVSFFEVEDEYGVEVSTRAIIARLVDVGLVEPVEGGYYLHDYPDFQQTAEQLAMRREQKAEAGRKGGQAAATARATAPAKAPATAGGSAEGIAAAQARVPGPVKPSTQVVSPAGREPSRLSTELSTDLSTGSYRGVDLAEVWHHAGQVKLRLRRTPPDNPDRWLKRVLANLPAEQGATVIELIDTYDEPANTIAEILLDQRDKRYLTRRPETA